MAERLSFLSEEAQGWVLQNLNGNTVVLSKSRAERLKEESERGILTEERVRDILNQDVKRISITISCLLYPSRCV